MFKIREKNKEGKSLPIEYYAAIRIMFLNKL